jgi:hypothetical protein
MTLARLPQIKKGYIRGVRGAVLTPLNADGTVTVGGTQYGIRTIQSVPYDVKVVEGAEDDLRGGGKILAHVEDPDVVVGLTLVLKDARFDAEAILALAGGALVEGVEGTDTRVTGWEAPTIKDQQEPPHFKLEVYATSHGSRGEIESYTRYTCHFCRATFGNENLEDRAWAVPEIRITCLENPSGAAGLYRKEFVSDLPVLLTA